MPKKGLFYQLTPELIEWARENAYHLTLEEFAAYLSEQLGRRIPPTTAHRIKKRFEQRRVILDEAPNIASVLEAVKADLTLSQLIFELGLTTLSMRNIQTEIDAILMEAQRHGKD